jgi:hypothetical protein
VSEDPALTEEPDRDDAAWDAWSHEAAARRRSGRRSAAARRYVFVLAALATIALVAIAVIVVVSHHGSSTPDTNSATVGQVESAHTALTAHRKTCPAGNGQLDCLRRTAEELSLAYRNFNIDLDRISLPAAASDARDSVEEDAELVGNAYDQLSVSMSVAAYDRLATRVGLTGVTGDFDRHYAALVAAIRRG